ncbi:MAG: ABC transporter substrate-binding protein [Candidatus Kapabacteria bacterium]|nr:ABC transporter substrate-binding protein [Candidatus Kapabacteria bacterium]
MHLRIALSCSFILLCFFFSCTKQKSKRIDTFYYNETEAIANLDPALISYRSAIWVGTQIFNGLVELDSSLQIKGCIAKSWDIDSTGKIWTFHLRTDVYFHSHPSFGHDSSRIVTAGDFKYSFERICNASTKSTGLWLYSSTIKDAKEFHLRTKKISTYDSISGIVVVNDSTLRLELIKPTASFLAMLTMPYCWVVPKEVVELEQQNFGMKPIGTGPFTLASWKPEIDMVLDRNTRYFKVDSSYKQLPYLNQVQISFVKDSKSEFLQFTRGEYDFIGSLDPVIAPTVVTTDGKSLREKYKNFTLFECGVHSVEYYGMLLDTSNPIVKNIPLSSSALVRHALNLAIDREKIVRFVLRGAAIPATNGILPPSMPGFSSDVKGYTYNLDSAQKLLALAGFPQGNGFPPITLQIGANERSASVAEVVQENWKQLGINVTIVQVTFPKHLSMIRNGELPLWRTSWIGDYPDPENFLALFASKNFSPKGPNTTHFYHQMVDSLMEIADSPLLPSSERYKLYNQIEEIVLKNAPWILLYYNKVQWLVQPNVRGMYLDGSNRLLLEKVSKSL